MKVEDTIHNIPISELLVLSFILHRMEKFKTFHDILEIICILAIETYLRHTKKSEEIQNQRKSLTKILNKGIIPDKRYQLSR